MKLLRVILLVVTCVVSLVSSSCNSDATDIPDEITYIAAAKSGYHVPIHGSLETVKGVPILRLWGSHFRMGYALGYLCADRIMNLLEYWQKNLFENYSLTYGQLKNRMDRYVLWADDDKIEVEGCLYGIQAALGGLPIITNDFTEGEPKQLSVEMLLVNNCGPQLLQVEGGCSGFAAWGEATGDGQTRIGANHDFFPEWADYWVWVVRKPNHGLKTVSLQFIDGLLSTVAKGMNETGLALTLQGSYAVANPSWITINEQGYTSIEVVRYILEHVSAGPNMVCDIIERYQNVPSINSGITIYAQKKLPDANLQPDQMAVVIEKDAWGFNARLPSHNPLSNFYLKDAIIATNHYLIRTAYETFQGSIDRYNGILNVLSETVISGVEQMQLVLQAASQEWTIDSVYMEPDTLTIYISYGTTEGEPACFLTPVKFTWDELFDPIPD